MFGATCREKGIYPIGKSTNRNRPAANRDQGDLSEGFGKQAIAQADAIPYGTRLTFEPAMKALFRFKWPRRRIISSEFFDKRNRAVGIPAMLPTSGFLGEWAMNGIMIARKKRTIGAGPQRQPHPIVITGFFQVARRGLRRNQDRHVANRQRSDILRF